MTGFGTARRRLSGRFDVAVVVRSVNNRFLDIQVRLSLREEMPEVEAAVRKVIENVATRGRIVVQVDFRRLEAPESRVLLDRAALEDLTARLEGLDIRAGELLGVPGLVTVTPESASLDEAEVEALLEAVSYAADEFVSVRETEGSRLVERIRSDLGEIETFLDWIEPQTGDFRRRIFERLREKLTELLGEQGVDEDRAVREAALLADRADVAEELVRLRAHLESFSKRLDAGGAVGKALDFLCQEIHRELNTLGTKCRELGVTDRVVDAKGAAERVREQVQNLE